MKYLMALMSLLLVASPARAVDFRWTSGFNQGTLEAIIKNGNGSDLVIYCPLYQTDTTPGMFIQVKRIKPPPGEPVTVQIIVDGKNYPFSLNEIEFKPIGRANQWEFRDFVHALISSKRKSFVVEFPKYKTAETFSLLDAQESLGPENDSILKGCGEKDW